MNDPLLNTTQIEGEQTRTRPYLVVIGPSAAFSVPLPVSGALRIGRAPGNDVSVDDPLISREHAVLHVGEPLEIEDLGSANGVVVRGRRLERNTRAPLPAGCAIHIGSSVLMIQERAAPLPSLLRLWPFGHFELRVEQECGRVNPEQTPFAVLRVHLEGPITGEQIERVMTSVLCASDVVSLYAPGEYAVLLFDADRPRAQELARRIRDGLSGEGASVRAGIAVFPSEGRSAENLLGAASAALIPPRAADESGVIIEDEAMRDLVSVAGRIAQGTLSVLLLGETGVGKEVFAELIHRRSPRRAHVLMRFNCAALSESLLESELFGHEKGAFTGADTPKVGLLEAADGGTVFLDEIGEMPPALQAKLLRVFEQREVLRVGSLKPRAINVRFIAATNRDLELEIQRGKFREDLYFRLNGISIVIPPLRTRTREIPALADMFLLRIAESLRWRRAPAISERAMELLTAYRWPGNVRELRNVLERALLLSGGELIQPEHLPVDKMRAGWAPPPQRPSQPADEREQILRALDEAHGNQARAAAILGVSRRTLSTWLDRHSIPRPRKGTPRPGT